jgi:dolichyl-phosphate-mannose-protein mannosyltransferase
VRIADRRPEIAAGLAEPEPTATRPRVWRVATVPFAFGAGFRVLVVLYVQALHGNFLFLDDQGYDRIGWLLAQAWHMNQFPSPVSVAVTSSYLYYVFVAAVYFVFGRHWVLVKLIAALLSALSVPAAAAVGDSLGGRHTAMSAAWLTALYPTAIFWGATGLKDGPLATLMLVMAAIALRPLTMRRLAAAVVLLAVAFLSRPVEGVVGLAMLVVPAIELARRRWPGRVRPVGTGSRLLILLAGLPVLLWISISLASQYLPVLNASLGGQTTLSLGTGPVAINFFPSPFDLVHALLSPVRWFGPATAAAYGPLVPGMVVWTAMLPASVLGCWELLRRGPWAARGIVVPVLAYIYVYTCVFQSQGFTRQRFTVEILVLVMGLYAFERFPQRAAVWTAIAVCVIAPAALVEARALPPLGFALVLIALGALLFAEESGTLARVRRTTRKRSAMSSSSSGSGQSDAVGHRAQQS